jgi:hypothetical protein
MIIFKLQRDGATRSATLLDGQTYISVAIDHSETDAQ